jgi:hypothetical protein
MTEMGPKPEAAISKLSFRSAPIAVVHGTANIRGLDYLLRWTEIDDPADRDLYSGLLSVAAGHIERRLIQRPLRHARGEPA